MAWLGKYLSVQVYSTGKLQDPVLAQTVNIADIYSAKSVHVFNNRNSKKKKKKMSKKSNNK